MPAFATMCALVVVIWFVSVGVRVARLAVLSAALSSVPFATVRTFGLLLWSTMASSHHRLLIRSGRVFFFIIPHVRVEDLVNGIQFIFQTLEVESIWVCGCNGFGQSNLCRSIGT